MSSNRDATLKTLAVNPGKVSPGFSSGRTNYTVYLPHGTDAVRVTPTASDPGAAVAVNGSAVTSGQASPSILLNAGRNLIRVEVTAQDGKMKGTYIVKVIRAYPTPTWVRVKENAPWVARDSAGELVFKGRMCLFGGYIPSMISDAWSSANGVTWMKEGEIPL